MPILMLDLSIMQMVAPPNADEQIVEREWLLFRRFSGYTVGNIVDGSTSIVMVRHRVHNHNVQESDTPMFDGTPEYDHEELYKGYTLKRFPYLKSGGGVVGSDEIVEVQYYHYHVFSADVSAHIHEAPSPELARQFVDGLER